MQSAINLKQKLDARQLTLGALITNHLWLEMIEIAQYAGLDYVIVDLEHTDHGGPLVTDACRLGRMTDFPVLVRPGWPVPNKAATLPSSRIFVCARGTFLSRIAPAGQTRQKK